MQESNSYVSEFELYFSYVWDKHRADIDIIMLPNLSARDVDHCTGAEHLPPSSLPNPDPGFSLGCVEASLSAP